MSKLLVFKMLPAFREANILLVLTFQRISDFSKSVGMMNCATSIVRFETVILSDTSLLRST